MRGSASSQTFCVLLHSIFRKAAFCVALNYQSINGLCAQLPEFLPRMGCAEGVHRAL